MSRPFDSNARELSNDIWLSICALELVLTRHLRNEEAYPGREEGESTIRIASLQNRLSKLQVTKHTLLEVISAAET
jgi:hypothetical protein